MRSALTAAVLAFVFLSTAAAGQENREAPAGAGRLRSFAAIRSFELAPPFPGTDEAHAALAELFRTQNETYIRRRVEQDLSGTATCTFRIDLSTTPSFELPCRAPDGTEIGLLRAETGEALLSVFRAAQDRREVPEAVASPPWFGAVRRFALAPWGSGPVPEGSPLYQSAAKTHGNLFGAFRERNKVLIRREVESNKAHWSSRDFGPTHATCTLHGDLPQPGTLALECRDAGGSYIGTLRAKDEEELRGKLQSLCFPERDDFTAPWRKAVAVPEARPLHEYRYLWVDPAPPGSQWAEDQRYFAELVSAGGPWRVANAIESVPREDTQRVLGCRLRTWSGNAIMAMGVSARAVLELTDSEGRAVREIWGVSRLTGGRKAAIRDAVSRLGEARRLDEEIHGPLAAPARR